MSYFSISIKPPTVKFLELIFRNIFFIFNFSNRFAMKILEENFRQLLQKDLVLGAQTDFCVYR